MEAGVNATEKENITAWIELESPGSGAALFSSSESSRASSPCRISKRLRRRLVLEGKTPSTVEEIEAKLRDADLRRQQYYEMLVSKARSKARSPSHSSPEEEDLGQRIEAKLQAAEQKRLSMLAKAQKRLARLDELRQAAKAEMKLHYEELRLELGTKVKSRAQKAEENRLLILKAYKERKATLNERLSMSLYRRITRENKYKECVRAAIYQKRTAAETKRLGLVEVEKKKAHARALQVRQVANSVYKQREMEVRMRKQRLEDRLMRARRQRAEYLKYRGKQAQLNMMQKQAELLSWKLARCWRRFVSMRRTTFSLAESYDVLKINEKCVKSMPFEQLAVLIESIATLKTVKELLDRLEYCLKVYRVNSNSQTIMANVGHRSTLDNIDHLLKRVSSPKRKSTPKTLLRSMERNEEGSISAAAKNAVKMSRYPVRVVLCAYMIVVHPDAVFSGQGVREKSLAECAEEFVKQFELLVKIILEGPIQSSEDECDSSSPKRSTFRSQLLVFDDAWCSYLNCFVVWKVKDARLLEDDLVRAACQLELSMIQTCKFTSDGENVPLTHDMKAIQKQVINDQKLLREKVQHLSGDIGIQRMERALSETRTKYFVANDDGSSTGSPTMGFTPSPSAGTSLSSSSDLENGVNKKPRHIVRSLFRDDDTIAKHKGLSNEPPGPVPMLVTENECLVNEFLHEQYHIFPDTFIAKDKRKDVVKMRIRETMEKAFWDGIEESLKQDEPNYDKVVQLMEEVRDELCKVSPESWKQQINDTIDVDILSQVLNSRNLDVSYLGRTLEFALVTLQKLSSQSKEDERKASHQKFQKELAEICQSGVESNNSCVVALIKGLRFVLEQIQVLNQEISVARIGLLKPILEGPGGVDYLRDCFSNRYGLVTVARESLPLTLQWMSSVSFSKDEEWEDHQNSLLALGTCGPPSQACLPSTALRAGRRMGATISAAEDSSGRELPECKGGKVDLIVRLGLLKLVTRVPGLTQEELPETFSLNLSRFRAVQAQIQQIIVMIISILVCRQTIVSEQPTTSVTEMEGIVAKCVERLSDMLNRVRDAGIDDISEAISKFDGEDGERAHSRRLIVGRMIGKCMQSGDAVFEKVSRALYVALRGVLLGGNGPKGKRLAESALRLVGAGALTGEVMKAGQILASAATVSVAVHGPWYEQLC